MNHTNAPPLAAGMFYFMVAPLGVLLITAGVDVQGNRLEVELVGWGADDESWSLDYKVFEGDPAQPAVWLQLEEYLAQEVPCEWGGTMKVAAAAVDTGGHHTNHVYRFCRRHRGRRFYAVKGANTPGKPLAPLKPTLQGSPPVPLHVIGTEAAKDTLANHLVVEEPGPGYCHFPVERTDDEGRTYYGDEYFKQLRSERAVMRGNVRTWKKIKPGMRNEALDVRVYAMAAKAILRPNMKGLQRRLAAAVAAAEAAREEEAPPAPQESEERAQEAAPARAARPFVGRGRGNFVNSWRGEE